MAVGYQRDSPRFVVGTVSAAHFFSHFYYLVFPPLFPLLAEEFEVTNTQLGLLFSLLFLVPSVLQLPVGELVDRFGAKRLFVAGIAVTAIGTSSTALAGSYPALLALAMLAGLGQSAFHPANFALLDAVTDETNRGRGFGAHTFAGYLGFAAGPIVAGGLGLRFGWRPALAVLGAVGVAYAVVVSLAMAPVHRGRTPGPGAGGDGGGGSSWALLSDPRIVATVAFFVLLTVASTGIQSFTVVFLTSVFGLDAAAATTTLTANLGATAVGVLVGGVLADRVSIFGVLATTLTLAGAIVVVIVGGAVPHAVPAALAAFTVLGLVHGLALPSRDSLVSTFSTSDSTGKSFGLAYTGVTFGAFVAPVTLGFVSDAVNDVVMYALVAVFYAAALVMVLGLSLDYRRRGGMA